MVLVFLSVSVLSIELFVACVVSLHITHTGVFVCKSRTIKRVQRVRRDSRARCMVSGSSNSHTKDGVHLVDGEVGNA